MAEIQVKFIVDKAKSIPNGVAVRYKGQSCIMHRDKVDKMLEEGVAFAWLCEQDGQIVTIPVNTESVEEPVEQKPAEPEKEDVLTAYEDANEDLANLLDFFKYEIERQPDKIHWGHVGNLNHVRQCLIEALAFLSDS
ncbi:MAG: hypothetical protein JXA82_15635, partial [Sedimentisphaerales bacterium]|nr:hypothetical protein [Sedimentisphaerales bacterium]